MITLGIDYGTTKNAIVVLDSTKPDSPLIFSAPHHAAVADLPECQAEQNPALVWNSLLELLGQIPEDIRRQIQAIGLTGQMHSMMLWNDDGKTSSVITWQDKRASADNSLAEFRQVNSRLADGFGFTSLAWLAKNHLLEGWQHAGSPLSWLACRLTNTVLPVIDHTFAASWGLWELLQADWNHEQLQRLNIPENLLPRIVIPGSQVGHTVNVPGLPDDLPVYVALGDNQASVLGSARNLEGEIYLTLGTGAQLSFVITPDEITELAQNSACEIRPFLNGNFLAVNAPLCGGRAWAWLGNAVNNILKSLGLPEFPEGQLLDKLDSLALQADSGDISFDPLFLGERRNPQLRASITGLNLDNFSLPALARSLAAGIVRQLVAPFPPEFLQRRHCVVGSGNCVRLCQTIQQEISRQTALPLELRQTPEEAATGAAKLAR